MIHCCPLLCGGQAHPPPLQLPFRTGPCESFDQLLSSPMWWPSSPTPLCDYLFAPGPVSSLINYCLFFLVAKLTHPLCDYLLTPGLVSYLINFCPLLCGGQADPPSLRLPFRARRGETWPGLEYSLLSFRYIPVLPVHLCRRATEYHMRFSRGKFLYDRMDYICHISINI